MQVLRRSRPPEAPQTRARHGIRRWERWASGSFADPTNQPLQRFFTGTEAPAPADRRSWQVFPPHHSLHGPTSRSASALIDVHFNACGGGDSRDPSLGSSRAWPSAISRHDQGEILATRTGLTPVQPPTSLAGRGRQVGWARDSQSACFVDQFLPPVVQAVHWPSRQSA